MPDDKLGWTRRHLKGPIGRIGLAESRIIGKPLGSAYLAIDFYF
jgi:hypothetical protein